MRTFPAVYTATWEVHKKASLAEGHFLCQLELKLDGLCTACRAAACLDPSEMPRARTIAKFDAHKRVRTREGHNWVWAWVYMIVWPSSLGPLVIFFLPSVQAPFLLSVDHHVVPTFPSLRIFSRFLFYPDCVWYCFRSLCSSSSQARWCFARNRGARPFQ